MSRVSDIALLVPAFRERLEMALRAQKGQGYAPVLWETRRSRERAAEMVAHGKSKARGGLSMHCYDIAADVICGAHQWSCRKHRCKFFEAWGANAEDAALTWGGNWDRDAMAGEDGENDLPHVQAVPLRFQDRVRAMPAEHLDAFVRSVLMGLVRR